MKKIRLKLLFIVISFFFCRNVVYAGSLSIVATKTSVTVI